MSIGAVKRAPVWAQIGKLYTDFPNWMARVNYHMGCQGT